ncbi:S-layer homology domain-containing protein, partial [Petrocella sp. FN5]|uniref:CAP and S-layer homology domain-containing protein n=1 Tax=Petrocella sp. FN5 TaxID=3032002 RepID=UPI0023DA2728
FEIGDGKIMKRLIVWMIIIFIAMSSRAYASGIDNQSRNDADEIERTVNAINISRENMSLRPLRVNNILKEMALTHSKYMNHNKTLTSMEQGGKLYFRGRYPWDRASYYKYNKTYVYEFVKKDLNNYMEGYNQLINDPLTRIVLLDNQYLDIGMNKENNYFTYIVGGSVRTEEQLVIYPYDGLKNVPIKWLGDSHALLYKNTTTNGSYGMPVTVTYYGNPIAKVTSLKSTIVRKDNGKAVNHRVVLPTDFHQLKNTITLLPLESYDQNTTYQVKVSLILRLENGSLKYVNETVEFATTSNVVKTTDSRYMTRALFVEKVLKNQLLGFTLQEPLKLEFKDVNIKSTESIYIYTASQENLISGFPDQTFRPLINITKEQAYTILIKAYEKKFPKISLNSQDQLNQYLDHANTSSWARESLLKAQQLGILIHTNKKIEPQAFIKENEFDQIMALFSKVLKEK